MLAPRLALALLLAPFPACLDTEQTEVGSTTREADVPVVWTLPVTNVQVTGTNNNGLTKNNGIDGAWDAGATSQQSIGGHGFVRFATNENTKAKAIGLSNGNTNQDISDIDYAFYLRADGNASIYQNGNLIQGVGAYSATDLFEIEATPDSVLFKRKRQNENSYTVLRIMDISAGLAFPLLVDTALRHQGATLVNVVVNEDPKIHVAVQGGFYTGDLNCGTADAISIHGSALLQFDPTDPNLDTYQEFANTSPPAVRDRLLQYAESHGIGNPANEDRILILDIENATNPSRIWGDMVGGVPDHNTLNEQDLIITGLKNRVIGARLAFPLAKLALYGTLIPDENGEDIDGTTDEEFEWRYEALIRARDQGLFDDPLLWDRPAPFQDQWVEGLDYLAPVLYIRFGCNQSGCQAGYADIGTYTALGLTRSQTLNTSTPLLPLMSTRIQNTGTYSHHLIRDLEVPAPDPEDPFAGNLTVQMNAFRDAGVANVVLWIGGQGQEDLDVLLERNEGPTGNCVVDEEAGSWTGVCWTVNDYTCWL